MYGASRGAEQALIISTLESIGEHVVKADALALHAPSDVIVSGWSRFWKPGEDHSRVRAWTWQGSSAKLKPGKIIRAELFAGPTFIIHGIEDELWSVNRSRHLLKRREKKGRATEVWFASGEGHVFRKQKLWRKKLLDLPQFQRTVI